jgi:Putative zinc-finger
MTGKPRDDILGMVAMDHSEARQQMLAEKYLLNELPSEARDAFEEHFFDCPECAFDLRAGEAFVKEAKIQLPGLTVPPPQGFGSGVTDPKRNGRFSLSAWLKPLFASPAFAAPVFATLLLVVGYQNLVMLPAMRTAATEPRLLPSVALHTGSRGGAPTVVEADRKHGVALAIDVPEQGTYPTYAVDLYDPAGKLAWTQKISASEIRAEDGTLTLAIPGAGLSQGTYSLAISGVSAAGQNTEIARRAFDIHFND